MNVVAELTLEAICEAAQRPLDQYSKLLRTTFENRSPAFTQEWYGKKYRHYAVDPLWLCQSLIDNSNKEGEGSTKLWKLASGAPQHRIAEAVRVHAIDEARHCRLYLGMLKTAFPGSVDEANMRELLAQTPPFTIKTFPESRADMSDRMVLDHLIQMNIGEIRTRVHQLLLMPVIQAHCPIEKRRSLKRALGSILDDETKHIRYTAEIIEAAIVDDSRFVSELLVYRLEEFNQITLDEVGESSFADDL